MGERQQEKDPKDVEIERLRAQLAKGEARRQMLRDNLVGTGTVYTLISVEGTEPAW